MGEKNWQDLHTVVKHSQEQSRSYDSVACLFKKGPTINTFNLNTVKFGCLKTTQYLG